MTVDRRRELEDKAHTLAVNGSFREAADTYVRAAFEEAGQFFGLSSRGIELRMLYKACLCYRLTEQERPSRFIASFAIGLAREYAARTEEKPTPSHSSDSAERGVWYEFIGDIQVVAGLNDGIEAYDRAKTIYREAGDPRASFGEGPIRSVQAIFDDMALHADADEELVIDATQGRLTDWVDYKQEHLPKLINIILSSREWYGPEQ